MSDHEMRFNDCKHNFSIFKMEMEMSEETTDFPNNFFSKFFYFIMNSSKSWPRPPEKNEFLTQLNSVPLHVDLEKKKKKKKK
jgi:hypothetical protein